MHKSGVEAAVLPIPGGPCLAGLPLGVGHGLLAPGNSSLERRLGAASSQWRWLRDGCREGVSPSQGQGARGKPAGGPAAWGPGARGGLAPGRRAGGVVCVCAAEEVSLSRQAGLPAQGLPGALKCAARV